MQQKSLLIAGLAIFILAASGLYWFTLEKDRLEAENTPLEIPANLIRLDNFDQVTEIFNRDSGFVRVIALLSPSWPASLRAFSALQDIAKQQPDVRIRFYIIWIPIYQTDDWQTVVAQSNQFQDARLTYFWDPNQISGITWQQALNFDQTAWDLYFIYGREKRWQFEPDLPEFWMRQLKGVVEAPLFDAAIFESRIKEML